MKKGFINNVLIVVLILVLILVYKIFSPDDSWLRDVPLVWVYQERRGWHLSKSVSHCLTGLLWEPTSQYFYLFIEKWPRKTKHEWAENMEDDIWRMENILKIETLTLWNFIYRRCPCPGYFNNWIFEEMWSPHFPF